MFKREETSRHSSGGNMNKLKQAIVALVHAEPFYGHLILSMRITQDDKIPTAGVWITDKVNLAYNKEWIENLSVSHAAKVLKHECEHIFKEHISRAKQIGATSKELHKRFNLATDVTINRNDLVPMVNAIGGVTVATLNDKLKVYIDEFNAKPENKSQQRSFSPMIDGQLAEYYYNRINEFAEQNKDLLPESGDGEGGEGMGETTDDHSTWEKSEGSAEVQKEIIKDAVNNAVKKAGGIGSVSGDIASMVSKLNESQVNWKQQLRQFFVNTQKSVKMATRKKRNRRYGILQPGSKRKPELHLGLCVDTSGSVSDKELSMFWAEMEAIYKCGVKLTVLEADSAVKNVYDFDPRKQPDFKGRGGTAYQPAITKAVELKVDGIIYCGDFDSADTPVDPKKPFLWVGVRQSPPPAKFGKVIYIKEEK
jgi:predicted metal-dependent peptidase